MKPRSGRDVLKLSAVREELGPGAPSGTNHDQHHIEAPKYVELLPLHDINVLLAISYQLNFVTHSLVKWPVNNGGTEEAHL